MARKGPLLTLLGGGVLAGALLIAGTVAAAGDQDEDGDLAAAGATPSPTAAATASAEPTADPYGGGQTAEPTADPADQQPVTYVGYVDGGGASVAIVINGEDATAYVCDGVTEAWLDGTAVGGELNLAGDAGELVGSYDAVTARGETTANGQTWTFTIDEVAPPEGLYRVADTILGGAEVEGGWIVLPDGRQVGVLTVDGESTSAPRIDPDTGDVTVDGATVTADRVGEETG